MPCDLLQEIHSAYAALNLLSVSIAGALQHTPSHAEVCADRATRPKVCATVLRKDNAGSTKMLARFRARESGRGYTILQHGNALCSGAHLDGKSKVDVAGLRESLGVTCDSSRIFGRVFNLAASL